MFGDACITEPYDDTIQLFRCPLCHKLIKSVLQLLKGRVWVVISSNDIVEEGGDELDLVYYECPLCKGHFDEEAFQNSVVSISLNSIDECISNRGLSDELEKWR